MPTKTRLVFLMHPKEFKEEKAGTGRLTHLCLPNSEIRCGVSFEDDQDLQAMLRDPANFSVLLYPGVSALNLSKGQLTSEALGGRRLLVLLLDGTWSCARKMLRLSPSLQRLPRIMFTPGSPSRFLIKQQPQEGCLSTLEATHELFLALQQSGLDDYSLPSQLLELFDRMQKFQIQCAADPSRPGYRRKPYTPPAQRAAARSVSTARKSRLFIKT